MLTCHPLASSGALCATGYALCAMLYALLGIYASTSRQVYGYHLASGRIGYFLLYCHIYYFTILVLSYLNVLNRCYIVSESALEENYVLTTTVWNVRAQQYYRRSPQFWVGHSALRALPNYVIGLLDARLLLFRHGCPIIYLRMITLRITLWYV